LYVLSYITFLISVALSVIDGIIGLSPSGIYPIYSLAILLPSIAVGVRRLHDINKSGWMLLIAFIPLIGWIWLIILTATEGTKGDNEYGSDPKETIIE
jgi:uncharacterized membrane protein YhaH (DUF805 family)